MSNENRKSLVIFISSAGVEPWESIEKLGQAKTFGLLPSFPSFWYQGAYSTPPIYEKIAASYFEKSYQIFWTGRSWENWLHVTKLNRLKNVGIVTWAFNKLVNKRFTYQISDPVNQILRFPVSSRFGVTGLKALFSIKYFLENTNADYMLRTNSSSYFDLNALENFIKDLPVERVYAGLQISLGSVNFNSGAANIISRDVAEQIFHHRLEWNHEYPEDVALGELIQKFDLADQFDFGRIEFIDPEDIDYELIRSRSSIFHYRCKSENPKNSIELMNLLHYKITGSEFNAN